MIDERIIEKILDRADIVDIIGSHVELKKKGANFTACCPFHQEKTPSFMVNPARGTWHCFGCGKGGNVIRFLMDRNTLTFPEAVRTLGKRYSIDVEETKLTPEQEQKRMKRDSMYIINQQCADHFRKNLQNPSYKNAAEYVKGRWEAKYAEEIGIGYAPASWDNLLEFAKKSGLSIDLMIEMGILKKRGEWQSLRLLPGPHHDSDSRPLPAYHRIHSPRHGRFERYGQIPELHRE